MFRNLDSVLLDLVGVETLELRVWGGGDRVHVGELAGTELTKVVLDLSDAGDAPDGEVDTIVVSATNGADDLGIERFGSRPTAAIGMTC